MISFSNELPDISAGVEHLREVHRHYSECVISIFTMYNEMQKLIRQKNTIEQQMHNYIEPDVNLNDNTDTYSVITENTEILPPLPSTTHDDEITPPLWLQEINEANDHSVTESNSNNITQYGTYFQNITTTNNNDIKMSGCYINVNSGV